MEVVFIGGPLHEEAMDEIVQNTKGAIWYSADVFQKKLLRGIAEVCDEYHVFSAPLIGAYPIGYKKIKFEAVNTENKRVHCVPFFNFWGLRNYSRAHQLKKSIKENLLVDKNKSYLIIVYCAHQPFLEAAKYLKENSHNSKICFYVPDLPQYMNLFKHSKLYDIAKSVDIKRMNQLIKSVDSFVILTDYMKDSLNIGNRPYFVAEGIVESIPQIERIENINQKNVIKIAYVGGLQSAFGIGRFVEDFSKNKDDILRLIICGAGDEAEHIQKIAAIDNRIEFKGQILSSEVSAVLQDADILINTRLNDSEYTKYSFPSKNIEYLMTGKRVVACLLDGMPRIYRDYIYEIVDGNYMDAVYKAVNSLDHREKVLGFQTYAKENLLVTQVITKIINL